MLMRRTAAVAALAVLVPLGGCGKDDVKNAVDQAGSAASSAKAAADVAADKAGALAALTKADNKLAAHPDEALDAARRTCAFIAAHSDEGKQVEEVRQRFDKVGATSLEAAQAKAILKVLKTQVCPRLK